jgi:TolB-like protein/class 3 adenylate cyclase/Flp pilus assembly protein TadD
MPDLTAGGLLMKRRLATILFADIAGYSRLMSMDESGTLTRLLQLRGELLEPEVASHSGRIVDYTGDGMLAEFADPGSAVQCAIAIQKKAAERELELATDRRLALRIGIHAADVIDEAQSIFGDGVNIASRLEQLAEPGGLCLSDDVYRAVADTIDIACEFGGDARLKNIENPVGVWLWPTAHRIGDVPQLPPPAGKPSLAVLPFLDLGGSDTNTAFADGLVEDLTTALGRLNWLFVVARTSTFALRGQTVDAKEASRRLGVRYLLEGSVRRAGDRFRLNAQLIDATSGSHLWAERFDAAAEDIFDLQDRVVASTIAAIEPSLLRAEGERARRTRPSDMRAHEYYLRAVNLMHAALVDPAGGALDEARGLLATAVELEPNYAPALALAGYFEAKALLFGRLPNVAEARQRALGLVERALRADDSEPLALGAYGFVSANEGGDLDRAAAMVERALTLNPNSALLWNFAGEVRLYLGEHERAITCFLESMRLNPLDQRAITNAAYLAFAFLFLGQADEAVRWAERAVHFAPNPLSYRILAASLAAGGRISEAREATAKLLALQPNSCLQRSRGANYRRTEDLARYVDSLQKAGLPDAPTGALAPE